MKLLFLKDFTPLTKNPSHANWDGAYSLTSGAQILLKQESFERSAIKMLKLLSLSSTCAPTFDCINLKLMHFFEKKKKIIEDTLIP